MIARHVWLLSIGRLAKATGLNAETLVTWPKQDVEDLLEVHNVYELWQISENEKG